MPCCHSTSTRTTSPSMDTVRRWTKVLTFSRGPYDSYTVRRRMHTTGEGDARTRRLDTVSKRFRVIVATGMTLAAMSAANADAQFGPGTQFSLTGVVVVEGQSRVWLQEPSLTQNR